ncbi:conserved protein of unknown function [Streptantibioticus cattleyicolor NRRL 8057 = DSM 46488]|nr:LCP family protein [Streptomyces sp. SID5468]CCB74761.1 conserved protein of unknown function [Streptantibioticus cattleyicolor NRRL 8057 = DSM 46488]
MSEQAPGGGEAAGDGPGRPRSGGRRLVLKWLTVTATVVVLGAAAGACAYYERLNGNLHKGDLNLGGKPLDKAPANAAGQTPLNILLLGSDGRNTAEDLRLGGSHADAGRAPLADVEMLVHVAADRGSMTVLSVPRDTRVTIPRCTDPATGTTYPQTEDIINASLQHGGPGCTVATWEELTGIPIDHFMMIDFSGVVAMADAVGGVPVCVSANVYDKDSGLRLTKGTHVIAGQQALQWLRTRHGFEDGSDIGRTHAQHMYLNAMVRQLKSGAKLTDPGELMGLADAATKALTVDKGLGSVKKLYDLADDIKRVPTGRITMATMPWDPDPKAPDEHVVPSAQAAALFAMIRGDQPVDGGPAAKPRPAPHPSPADTAAPRDRIAVGVANGTGTAELAPVPGRAAEITARLAALGFTEATTDTTPRAQADTTISYPDAGLKADAEEVAKALGIPLSAVRKSPEVSGITLVVGADWRGGTGYPAPAPPPSADRLTHSASALNAGDTTACMQVNVAGGYSW